MNRLTKEALFTIAINLEVEDLLRLCEAYDYIDNKICEKDDIWLYKIRQQFPYLTLDILNKYKNGRSWKDYYRLYLYPTRYQKPNRLLVSSSRWGRLDLVMIAVNMGADINTQNNSPIKLASEYGFLDVVKYLVEHGVDVRDPEFEGLVEASFNGHLDVVKYLVEQGADVQAYDNAAIHYAKENEHYEVVKYLMGYGV